METPEKLNELETEALTAESKVLNDEELPQVSGGADSWSRTCPKCGSTDIYEKPTGGIPALFCQCNKCWYMWNPY